MEHLYIAVLATAMFLWATSKYASQRQRNKQGLPLPPGPKGLPIIGNILDMPVDNQWLVYDEWFKTYGATVCDIISFEALGSRFIILGSLARTEDLFEKRSSIYSSRPRMPMAMELMRWDIIMSFLPYGSWWRRHRKVFHDHFHPNVVDKYNPVQLTESRALLLRLLSSPKDFQLQVRLTFTSIIMKLAYGIQIKEKNDPYVETAEEALRGLAEAGIPGRFLVDLLPSLKYVPEWMPGASFKRMAKHWKEVNGKMGGKPWDDVKEKMKNGTAVSSLSTTLIEALPDESDPRREEEEKVARATAAVAFVGGADTTVSSINSFFLAMTLYPDVLKKAQAEIDSVIGSNRLPDFGDRDSLPYINALAKETMRWQAVTPLGVGHMSTQDDIYDGYFIPKDSIILGNVWSILHDPVAYPDPMTFKPDRFLKDGTIDPTIRNPMSAAFGFGRRICPGRYLADNSLYIIIASLVSVFDIKSPLDSQGKLIKQEPRMTSGLLS
ncbi:cytochrome P450 [Crucibulum laeve]|uniref:Cytochrome P450 n=1 Tax=Crucibulum laeve TaxID=68775 RepID=A0A5C3LT12_9AGAR|nr:cytochrome P450 [Crucibulum laeve]